MSIDTERTGIEGLLVIKPEVFFDERGYFTESFHAGKWAEAGLPTAFVQDNMSNSKKGTLRGLHFQKPPYAQGKLIRVIKGAILDVAVDLRAESPTYGQSWQLELSETNFLQFYVPPGFAHGFLTLADETIVTYKCTAAYDPQSEGGLPWNDKDLNINWGIEDPFLSEKDKHYTSFKNFINPF